MSNIYLAQLARSPSLTQIGQNFAAARDRRRQLDMQEQQQQAVAEQRKAQLAELKAKTAAAQRHANATARTEADKKRAQMLTNVFKHIDSAPEEKRLDVAARMFDYLRQRGIEIGAPQTGEVLDQGALGRVRAGAIASGAEAAGAAPPKREPLTEAGRRLVEAGVSMDHPNWSELLAKERVRLLDEKMKARRAGATTINNNIPKGNQPAERALRVDAQESLRDSEFSLDTFDQIRDLAKTKDGAEDYGQFLTLWSKGRATVARYSDAASLPPDFFGDFGMGRDEFAKVQAFRSLVDKYRSEEFKRLLGSAQSKQEIANLTNTIISSDMTPEQFRVALNTLERTAKRAQRISARILDEGFEVGTKSYNTRFEQLEKKDAARKQRLREIATRLVKDEGVSKADALRRAAQIVDGDQGG